MSDDAPPTEPTDLDRALAASDRTEEEIVAELDAAAEADAAEARARAEAFLGKLARIANRSPTERDERARPCHGDEWLVHPLPATTGGECDALDAVDDRTGESERASEDDREAADR